MKCLDTYILMEIANENRTFLKYINEEFIITNETLAEFVWVIIRDKNEQIADYWYNKLQPYCSQVPLKILVKAMKFRHKNKSKNLSFFDCVGYIYAIENKIKFVTGDKEFENLENVEFIK